jgi:leucyl/phenylalanyl-tRNA--protein transferase
MKSDMKSNMTPTMKSTYIHKRKKFANPADPTMDGIVAMGDDWDLDTLLEAYSFGIFPWPHPDLPCLWFCPDRRGILEFSELHIAKSLKKVLKNNKWKITFDQDFPQVIEACSQVPRKDHNGVVSTGTWITSPLLKAYKEFHKQGHAHSVEVWGGLDYKNLVGGLYGVFVGGVFSAESMFYKESNASKVAFIKLIEKLKSEGLTWLDIQMTTPVTESLGGKYISKKEFLEKVRHAKKSD